MVRIIDNSTVDNLVLLKCLIVRIIPKEINIGFAPHALAQ
jgi:hypothetical protein